VSQSRWRPDTEYVTASKTAIIVEDAFVNDFAQLGSSDGAGRASDAGCDYRTNKTAGQGSRRTYDAADHHAGASAG